MKETNRCNNWKSLHEIGRSDFMSEPAQLINWQANHRELLARSHHHFGDMGYSALMEPRDRNGQFVVLKL